MRQTFIALAVMLNNRGQARNIRKSSLAPLNYIVDDGVAFAPAVVRKS